MTVWMDQCGTCIKKNWCMERSRQQACRDYIKKDPGSGNCDRSNKKNCTPSLYGGRRRKARWQ